MPRLTPSETGRGLGAPPLSAGGRPRPGDVPRPLATAAAWSWRALVVAAAAGVALVLLARLRVVVFPVLGSLLLVAVLSPAVERLVRAGWRRTLAASTVLLGALAVLAGVAAAIGLHAASQAEDLRESFDLGLEDVRDWLVEGPLGLSRARVDEVERQAREVLSAETLASGAAGGARVALEIVAGILLALVVTFFLLKDGPLMWRWLVGRLGAGRGPHVDEAGRRAWRTVGAYMRGTAIVAAVDAVLIGAAAAILGVPLAPAIGVVTFLAGFFPIVGAVTAGIVAVLVALAAEGLTTALILGAVVIAVQQLEGDLLQPLVVGRALRLHPLVVLLGVAAGGAAAGIPGALVAVPLIAAATAVGGYVRERSEAR